MSWQRRPLLARKGLKLVDKISYRLHRKSF